MAFYTLTYTIQLRPVPHNCNIQPLDLVDLIYKPISIQLLAKKNQKKFKQQKLYYSSNKNGFNP